MLRTLAVSLRKEGKVAEAEDLEAILRTPASAAAAKQSASQRNKGSLDFILDSAPPYPWTATAAAATAQPEPTKKPMPKEPWTAAAVSHLAAFPHPEHPSGYSRLSSFLSQPTTYNSQKTVSLPAGEPLRWKDLDRGAASNPSAPSSTMDVALEGMVESLADEVNLAQRASEQLESTVQQREMEVARLKEELAASMR